MFEIPSIDISHSLCGLWSVDMHMCISNKTYSTHVVYFIEWLKFNRMLSKQTPQLLMYNVITCITSRNPNPLALLDRMTPIHLRIHTYLHRAATVQA